MYDFSNLYLLFYEDIPKLQTKFPVSCLTALALSFKFHIFLFLFTRESFTKADTLYDALQRSHTSFGSGALYPLKALMVKSYGLSFAVMS